MCATAGKYWRRYVGYSAGKTAGKMCHESIFVRINGEIYNVLLPGKQWLRYAMSVYWKTKW